MRARAKSCSYAVADEVSEQCLVGFPPVREFRGYAEMDGLVWRMSIEQIGYAGAGDDDAGVAVTGCQHA